RATHVEPLEERPDGRRIDVVEHVQPRIVVALLIAQLVPVRLQQRLLQGGRAERRAADAEHDDRVERLTDALRKGPDLLRDGALVRKREEAQLSALAAPDGVRMD